jgi:hypothetical protein
MVSAALVQMQAQTSIGGGALLASSKLTVEELS